MDQESSLFAGVLAHEGMRDEDAAAVVEASGVSEDAQAVIASLAGGRAIRELASIYRQRAGAILAGIEHEMDEGVIATQVRLWQALRAVAEDLAFYPDACRQALQYNKTSGAYEAPEED